MTGVGGAKTTSIECERARPTCANKMNGTRTPFTLKSYFEMTFAASDRSDIALDGASPE